LVLPRLFEKLSGSPGHASTQGRTNALLVVAELFALCPALRGLHDDFTGAAASDAEGDGEGDGEVDKTAPATLLRASGAGAAVGAGTSGGGSSGGGGATSLARELGVRLLEHLGDLDLGLRAGRLVASLPPEFSVPRLFQAMLPEEDEEEGEGESSRGGGAAAAKESDGDGEAAEERPGDLGQTTHARRRAAAEAALKLSLVGAAADTAGGVRALLDCLAYAPAPRAAPSATSSQLPQTPAARTARSGRSDESARGEAAARALRSRLRDALLPRWLESLKSSDRPSTGAPGAQELPSGRWRDALRAVAHRVLAAPDDPAAVHHHIASQSSLFFYLFSKRLLVNPLLDGHV
jgi:hypothetical protein